MGVIATTDDLINAAETIGNMTRNAGISIRKLFDSLDEFNRRLIHEKNMREQSWSLYTYPNNRRKAKGKPLVRIRAYKKAWRNERRRK